MVQFDFSGLWIPIVTPFHDGQVDLPAFRRLARHLGEAGIRGFVVCGSTGEAHSLAHDEQLAVLDAALEVGKPVIMGLAGTRTDDMRARLEAFTKRPVVSLLVSAPYYVRPSQAGMLTHFRTLADASPVPLTLYDIPSRTGVALATETLLQLAAHPNIRAIKDSAGDPEKTRMLIADGRLAVLAGEDERIFPTLCAGGAGAIAASGHLLPGHFAALVAEARAGRLPQARRLYHALTPLSHALFSEPNPSVFKAVLARQGWIGDELRAPHGPASVEAVQRTWAALEGAERALDG